MSVTTIDHSLTQAPLGKKSSYVDHYDPKLLFPIPRKIKREEINIKELPFNGFDIWTGYELSWLNQKGLPAVRTLEVRIPCESSCLIESKSFKLYLNSFNNSKFSSDKIVREILEKDLSSAAQAPVEVKIFQLDSTYKIAKFDGICIDDQDIECNEYLPNPNLLNVVESSDCIEEVLYSDLLKSNCLVTGQPDWGSIQISYVGRKISHDGLLRYLVSFRNHNEFHEQCVERIFIDIKKHCAPKQLTVYARYTRRGGLDINPYRTSKIEMSAIDNSRLSRQ